MSDLLIVKQRPDLWYDLRQKLRRRRDMSIIIFPREGFDEVVDAVEAVENEMEFHDHR